MSDIEKQIMEAVRQALAGAVEKRLMEYGSPLVKHIDEVVSRKGDLIKALVSDAFEDALAGELRPQIRTALAHKLARILVSKMEGEIEKRVNDLRSNPSSRAAITLAVEAAIQKLQP